jgi:hypothetical protein
VLPPRHDPQAVAQRCRQMVTRRALLAAGVAMVPVPGLDWLTDVGLLVGCCRASTPPSASAPEQIERLAPDRRIVVYKAISAGGGLLIGKVVTRDLVLRHAQAGGRAPDHAAGGQVRALAGQAVSAALTYSALRYVCEQHIQQCRGGGAGNAPPLAAAGAESFHPAAGAPMTPFRQAVSPTPVALQSCRQFGV